MKYLLLTIFVQPFTASAHGLVLDGHEGALTWVDYLELGGVVVASLGLIIFSFISTRKNKNKDSKTDTKTPEQHKK